MFGRTASWVSTQARSGFDWYADHTSRVSIALVGLVFMGLLVFGVSQVTRANVREDERDRAVAELQKSADELADMKKALQDAFAENELDRDVLLSAIHTLELQIIAMGEEPEVRAADIGEIVEAQDSERPSGSSPSGSRGPQGPQGPSGPPGPQGERGEPSEGSQNGSEDESEGNEPEQPPQACTTIPIVGACVPLA